MSMRNSKQFIAARKYGYRSGLEHKISLDLEERRVKYLYEKVKIEWEDLCYRKYTPDFILNNGIIIESKGLFTAADRRKHLAIQKQHPKLDIRFIFENSRRKLRKGANTMYSNWCEKHGFLYDTRVIPEAWVKEKGKPKYPNIIPFPKKKVRV